MIKTYNIVTNQNIIGVIKQSKYFRVNLGMAVTMEKNGDRVTSDKDQFAASYNYQYKTVIYAQGNIGNIRFYTDYGIREDKVAVYLNLEEFIFDYDKSFISQKGIDSFIGLLLKNTDEMYNERTKKPTEEEKIEDKKVGSPEKLMINPGAVTYADIQEYIKNKKKL